MNISRPSSLPGRTFPVSLVLFCLIAGGATPSRAAATDTVQPAVDRAFIDPQISPCDDFYAFANGAYFQAPIPPEFASFGVDEELTERNEAILRTILETAAADNTAERGPVTQRLGDFFASGMDEPAIERAGLAPLAPWFARIAAVDSPAAVLTEIGRLQVDGIEVGFDLIIQPDDKRADAVAARFNQGGLGLPERDYYSRPGPEADAVRAAYVAHIARMLVLAGDAESAAHSSAAAIMDLETKLAAASRTLVELDDPESNYHPLTRAELAATFPDLDWETLFAALAMPAGERTVLIGQPAFFTAFGALLQSTPPAVWRDYLRWHLLAQTASALPAAWVEEDFSFRQRTLAGTPKLLPRWRRVLAATDEALGEDLGRLFVQRAFSPAAKQRVLRMVGFICTAMRARIAAADWMSEATKQEARRKLDTLRVKIGYPERWRDYRALAIARRPFVLNVLAARAFEYRRQLAKLGRPVDRDEWQMSPATNNAYYEPLLNEICFPAGVLQPPYFDERADDASNYGATGPTIGHELTHGFDDYGRRYDADGNLRDWWTAEDAARFAERADAIARQYDAFELLPGLHLNGRQTLDENIADIGGLRLAYAAFQLATADAPAGEIDGFTAAQRFFIAYAQSWRTNQRAEHLRFQIYSDVHAPARWRVTGAIAHAPEFRQLFNCPPLHAASAEIW